MSTNEVERRCFLIGSLRSDLVVCLPRERAREILEALLFVLGFGLGEGGAGTDEVLGREGEWETGREGGGEVAGDEFGLIEVPPAETCTMKGDGDDEAGEGELVVVDARDEDISEGRGEGFHEAVLVGVDGVSRERMPVLEGGVDASERNLTGTLEAGRAASGRPMATRTTFLYDARERALTAGAQVLSRLPTPETLDREEEIREEVLYVVEMFFCGFLNSPLN